MRSLERLINQGLITQKFKEEDLLTVLKEVLGDDTNLENWEDKLQEVSLTKWHKGRIHGELFHKTGRGKQHVSGKFVERQDGKATKKGRMHRY
jgi:hypothetical protein